VPAGGWFFGWFSTGRQGVSVGFRLVGGFFGRKSTGGEWSACLWAKLVGAWLWGGCWDWAGGSLACVPQVYTGWASADRGSGSERVYLRIACVYGKRIGTEQRSDVVSVSKNDGLRLYPKGNLLSPKLQKKTKR